jgi:hypothetical protein
VSPESTWHAGSASQSLRLLDDELVQATMVATAATAKAPPERPRKRARMLSGL